MVSDFVEPVVVVVVAVVVNVEVELIMRIPAPTINRHPTAVHRAIGGRLRLPCERVVDFLPPARTGAPTSEVGRVLYAREILPTLQVGLPTVVVVAVAVDKKGIVALTAAAADVFGTCFILHERRAKK